MPVDITNIDPEALLLALWLRQKPTRWGNNFNYDDRTFQLLLRSGLHENVDLCGRLIQVDFSTPAVNPSGFDRDAGTGAFQEVVTGLRAHCNINELRSNVGLVHPEASQEEESATNNTMVVL